MPFAGTSATSVVAGIIGSIAISRVIRVDRRVVGGDVQAEVELLLEDAIDRLCDGLVDRLVDAPDAPPFGVGPRRFRVAVVIAEEPGCRASLLGSLGPLGPLGHPECSREVHRQQGFQVGGLLQRVETVPQNAQPRARRGDRPDFLQDGGNVAGVVLQGVGQRILGEHPQ